MCWNVENAGTNTDRQAANGMWEQQHLQYGGLDARFFFKQKKKSGRGLGKQKKLKNLKVIFREKLLAQDTDRANNTFRPDNASENHQILLKRIN